MHAVLVVQRAAFKDLIVPFLPLKPPPILPKPHPRHSKGRVVVGRFDLRGEVPDRRALLNGDFVSGYDGGHVAQVVFQLVLAVAPPHGGEVGRGGALRGVHRVGIGVDAEAVESVDVALGDRPVGGLGLWVYVELVYGHDVALGITNVIIGGENVAVGGENFFAQAVAHGVVGEGEVFFRTAAYAGNRLDLAVVAPGDVFYFFLGVVGELTQLVVAVIVEGVDVGGYGGKGTLIVDVVVEGGGVYGVIDVVEAVPGAPVSSVLVAVGQIVYGNPRGVFAKLRFYVAVGVVHKAVLVLAVIGLSAGPSVGCGIQVGEAPRVGETLRLVVFVGVANGHGAHIRRVGDGIDHRADVSVVDVVPVSLQITARKVRLETVGDGIPVAGLVDGFVVPTEVTEGETIYIPGKGCVRIVDHVQTIVGGVAIGVESV